MDGNIFLISFFQMNLTAADFIIMEEKREGYSNAQSMFNAWASLCEMWTRGVLPRMVSEIPDFLFHLRLHFQTNVDSVFGACAHVNDLIDLANAGFFDSAFTAEKAFNYYFHLSKPCDEKNGRMLHPNVAHLFGFLPVVRDDIDQVYVNFNEDGSLNIVPHSRHFSLSFGDCLSNPISSVYTPTTTTTTATSSPVNVVTSVLPQTTKFVTTSLPICSTSISKPSTSKEYLDPLPTWNEYLNHVPSTSEQATPLEPSSSPH